MRRTVLVFHGVPDFFRENKGTAGAVASLLHEELHIALAGTPHPDDPSRPYTQAAEEGLVNLFQHALAHALEQGTPPNFRTLRRSADEAHSTTHPYAPVLAHRPVPEGLRAPAREPDVSEQKVKRALAPLAARDGVFAA